MPTGTGKTETMLALLVAAKLDRLLVVVPNDNLRSQISTKFIELGVLRACGCLGDRTQMPAVAVLRRPRGGSRNSRALWSSSICATPHSRRTATRSRSTPSSTR
jgi:hypothetical protein